MREHLSESERRLVVLRVKRVARLARMLGVSPDRETLPLNLDDRKESHG